MKPGSPPACEPKWLRYPICLRNLQTSSLSVQKSSPLDKWSSSRDLNSNLCNIYLLETEDVVFEIPFIPHCSLCQNENECVPVPSVWKAVWRTARLLLCLFLTHNPLSCRWYVDWSPLSFNFNFYAVLCNGCMHKRANVQKSQRDCVPVVRRSLHTICTQPATPAAARQVLKQIFKKETCAELLGELCCSKPFIHSNGNINMRQIVMKKKCIHR